MSNEAYKYIYNQNLMSAKASVHYENTFRADRAKEQAALVPARVQDIIEYTNKFLKMLGMTCIDNPRIENPIEELKKPDFYERIQKDYALECIHDIVWMSFTTCGFLGVVALGADINFDMPPSKDNYNDKAENQKDWKYTTSGIIVHTLNKKWDESFVLVFPLCKNEKNDYSRGDIECGIGNYLIDMGVPILDYYSHKF